MEHHRRIYVPMPESMVGKLLELSRKDRRDYKDEIVILLQEAMKQREESKD